MVPSAMIWQEKSFDPEVVSLLEKSEQIPPLTAKLLAVKNIASVVEAENFLRPKLSNLSDPFEIPHMNHAVERIIYALSKKEQILLIGDYDADGISSVSIIQKILSELGGHSSYVIPKRLDEGYGLSQKVLNRGLQNKNVSLVIALDCGTNSIQEATFLKDKEIDLIVVDHHKAKGDISDHPIILNPHLGDSEQMPWHNLCTAGLAFKTAHALVKNLKGKNHPLAHKVNLKEYLSLSAMGTIADLVPLRHENRIISKFGLKHLGHNPSTGINALLNESKINRNAYPQSEDITFKLAPMINACGRMDNPTVATSLFLENDASACRELARKMNEYNEQRKFIESQLTEEAEVQANTLFADKPAVVASGSSKWWHPGVVGIVAGKLANLLGKPCLVLAKSENGEFRGSGRGTEGLDLVHALAECKDLLMHWGGHPVAVGLSLNESNLEEFTERFIRGVRKQIGNTRKESVFEIDTFINQNELTEKLLEEVEMMAPFGQGNPEPILGLKKVQLSEEPRKVGSGHFQFSIHNGKDTIPGIAWRMVDNIPPQEVDIDIAFRLQWNNWNHRKRLQMVMQSWKLH